MISFLAYLSVAFAAYVFSQWTYNRCALLGGIRVSEINLTDYMFAFAVLAAIFGIRNI